MWAHVSVHIHTHGTHVNNSTFVPSLCYMGLFVCRISAECVWCVAERERDLFLFPGPWRAITSANQASSGPRNWNKVWLFFIPPVGVYYCSLVRKSHCSVSVLQLYGCILLFKSKVIWNDKMFWSTLKFIYLQSTYYRHKWEVKGKLADMTRMTSTKAPLDMLVEVERQHCNSPPGFGFWGWKTQRQTKQNTRVGIYAFMVSPNMLKTKLPYHSQGMLWLPGKAGFGAFTSVTTSSYSKSGAPPRPFIANFPAFQHKERLRRLAREVGHLLLFLLIE